MGKNGRPPNSAPCRNQDGAGSGISGIWSMSVNLALRTRKGACSCYHFSWMLTGIEFSFFFPAEKPKVEPDVAKVWTLSANDMGDDDLVSAQSCVK